MLIYDGYCVNNRNMLWNIENIVCEQNEKKKDKKESNSGLKFVPEYRGKRTNWVLWSRPDCG